MDHTTPPTPEHGPFLTPFVRTINVLTALSGLTASGIGGLYVIIIGMAFFWLVIPIILALLTIFLLYWGCGSYGAAFTRFEHFDWRRLLLQICHFAVMLTGSGNFYRSTHPLQTDNPLWHAPAATMLLIFFSFTLVVHLYSLTALFRFHRQVLERQSTQSFIGWKWLLFVSPPLICQTFKPAYTPPMTTSASPSHDHDAADDEAFREQCRRQMARPLATRMKYGFCRVHRPVLDTPGVRIFDSTKEYREWCATHLPAYLGFQPAPAV